MYRSGISIQFLCCLSSSSSVVYTLLYTLLLQNTRPNHTCCLLIFSTGIRYNGRVQFLPSPSKGFVVRKGVCLIGQCIRHKSGIPSGLQQVLSIQQSGTWQPSPCTPICAHSNTLRASTSFGEMIVKPRCFFAWVRYRRYYFVSDIGQVDRCTTDVGEGGVARHGQFSSRWVARTIAHGFIDPWNCSHVTISIQF